MRPDGSAFSWRGISSFKLLAVDAGQRDRVLDWCAAHGVNVVRVFGQCSILFSLPPDVARERLPALLIAAAARGLYVELTALCDTAYYPVGLMEPHLSATAAICAAHENALLESANEVRHETQRPELVDLVKRINPSGIPYAQGSTHGEDDESREFAGGTFCTVHHDRADGDRGWRWVRHSREGQVMAYDVNRYVVSDEPRRDDLDRAKHFAFGAQASLLEMGDTFHYKGGLTSDIPTGDELRAFEARWEGWLTFDAWRGTMKNATWTDSPVKSFNTNRAVRVYSSVEGNDGRTLAMGILGDPAIVWQGGWHVVTMYEAYPEAWAYLIAR